MQKIKGANKKKSRYYNDNAPLFSKLEFDLELKNELKMKDYGLMDDKLSQCIGIMGLRKNNQPRPMASVDYFFFGPLFR